MAYREERIILERRGKAVAVLVPMEDLSRLEALEDRLDAEAARRARRERGGVPYEDVRRKDGLK